MNKPFSTSRDSYVVLESIPKLHRRKANFVFCICQNSLFLNQDRIVLPSLTPLLPSLSSQKWLASSSISTSHCKSSSPWVLWCHQPGPGHLNPFSYLRVDLLVSHDHQCPFSLALLGTRCLKPIFLDRNSEAHGTNLCSLWDRVSHSAGGPSFLLFPLIPTDKKITFHFSFWVLFP